MSLSVELKAGVGTVWEQVLTHPFVLELGEGTLPRVTFDIYFDQDRLFLKDWAILLSLATAKSPDFDAAILPRKDPSTGSGRTALATATFTTTG